MMRLRRCVYVLLLVLVAGCSSPLAVAAPRPMPAAATPAQPTETAAPSVLQPSSTAAVSAPSPAAPPAPLERTAYTMEMTLDYTGRSAQVRQQVRYINDTGYPLLQLPLLVEANRLPDAFSLRSVQWADGSPVKDYVLNGARLLLPLPEVLRPGEALTVNLMYDLLFPARSAPFGFTGRQINLGDWYPFAPPYLAGRGWQMDEPGRVGEYLTYDLADFDVTMTLSAPNLVLAASAPAAPDSSGTRYHFQQRAARQFAASVSPLYRLQQARRGAVTLSVYTFPEHAGLADVPLQAMGDALDLYSERFAPYPRPSLTLVEADFLDGMEYDGLFFLGQEYFDEFTGGVQNYLVALSAHETAHQWWFGLVANNQAQEPWLDESLATYSELLFYRQYHPDAVDNWLRFRIWAYAPQGFIDGKIADYSNFRSYVNATYLRGALFLDALRMQMGDEAFFAFLQAYCGRSSGRVVTRDDFFATLKEFTPEDLSGLLRIYFQTPP